MRTDVEFKPNGLDVLWCSSIGFVGRFVTIRKWKIARC